MLTNSFSNYAPSYTRLRGRPIFGEARKNFSDLTVGNQELKILGPLGSTINLATKGYGVDLDGDGKFQGDGMVFWPSISTKTGVSTRRR